MMVVLVMKTTFPKLKLRIVQYRDYTQFSNNNFRKKSLVNLSLENINNKVKFLKICITALAQIAPRKKIIICHFVIKNYLTQINKKATKKSLS